VRDGRQRSEEPGRSASWRARASVAMACGVHSALLITIWRSHPANPAETQGRTDDVVVDLDVVPASDAPPPREVREPRSEPAAEGRGSQTQASAERTPARGASNPSGAEENGGVESVAPSPSGSSAQGWTFSPNSGKPVDLGIGTARTPKGLAPDAVGKVDVPADERPSTTGGLVEALDAEDAKRGVGRGGPVKLAVEAAARSTDAPTAGKATFDIAVGIDGDVHASLLVASADFEQWNQLIASIRGHLARKRVRFPPGSKGLHVVVEVEAHEQFPDGRTPASLGGKAGMTPEGPAAGYSGKVCGVGITLGGLGGGCSPENAGVPATRVVSSRITRETRL